MPGANPKIKEGRKKWDTCYHFENVFSSFETGDWEIWLELFIRWEVDETLNVPYALSITIEDLTKTLDFYSEIEVEAQGRFRPINTVRVPVVV